MGFLAAGWTFWIGIAGWIILLVFSLWGIGQLAIHFYVKFFLLKRYQPGATSEAVVILPSVNWKNLIAWIRPNYDIDDVKVVIAHATRNGKKVSVYNGPDPETVERLMRDTAVREVYFLGHGGTDFFRLGTEEVLCYSVFNDPAKYGKDFVHQVHCGSARGKSLIHSIVPEKNWLKCFFHPDKINSYFVEKEFKRLSELI